MLKERMTAMQDWSHIVLRSIGAIVMLFLIVRILGKKQISQLTFFEFILGITLGELAGFLSTDIQANYWHGILALLTWFIFAFLLELITLKSMTLRHWFEGRGTVMIKDGKVMEDNLKKERYTGDELMQSLRKKNVFKLQDVEFAFLESSGDLSVLVKKENQPLTPKHLGIKVSPAQEPQMVINDGKIMDEPLATIGLSREWLNTELEKLGIPVENVFLGQVDAFGELFVDLYDDQLKLPEPQNKLILWATLRKCEADLELFSLATKNESARKMYIQQVEAMKQMVTSLAPLLKH
jgi:uncharacterized membrane protein YcaP (DUF421 family)